jgi:hypothetical protein
VGISRNVESFCTGKVLCSPLYVLTHAAVSILGKEAEEATPAPTQTVMSAASGGGGVQKSLV